MKKNILGSFSSTTKILNSGEVIFKEGDTGNKMYIIKSGRVEVFREINDEKAVLAELKENDFFGEMALFGSHKRSASIQALEPSELHVITNETLQEQFNLLPPLFQKMITLLSDRIRFMDKRIKSRLKVGIELTVLNVLLLIIPDIGKMDKANIIAPLSIAVQRAESIFGFSKNDLLKVLETLKCVSFLEISVKKDSITLLDAENVKGFPDYVSCKITDVTSGAIFKKVEKLPKTTKDIFEKTYTELSAAGKEIFIFT